MTTGYSFDLPSSDQQHQLVATLWDPVGTPFGVAQIVHGMKEHMGRYQQFAHFLNQNGWIVCGHDHLGHGKTALQGGSYGYFGPTKGARVLVDDAAHLTRTLAEKYPRLPLFVLGHSMGSLIGRLQILQVAPLIHGFICMGTLGWSSFYPYARVIAQGIVKSQGGETISSFLEDSNNQIFRRHLKEGDSPDAWISHDPQVVEDYSADPYTQHSFTSQAYCDLFDLAIAANRPEWYQKIDPTLPMLLVSGKEDPVSNMGRDIPKIYDKLKTAGLLDVTYKLYDKMRHEVLNELGREKVYHDLLVWMKERL